MEETLEKYADVKLRARLTKDEQKKMPVHRAMATLYGRRLIEFYNKFILENKRHKATMLYELPFSDKAWQAVLYHLNNYYVSETDGITDARKRMVSNLFAGNRSESYTRKVLNLSVLLTLANDLQMPIVLLLYGFSNDKKVAQYNYDHYDNLTAPQRRFLVSGLYESGKVAELAQSATRLYSVRTLSSAIGPQVSHQVIYQLTAPDRFPNYLPIKRYVLDALADFMHEDLLTLLEFPIIPNPKNLTRNLKVSKQYKPTFE